MNLIQFPNCSLEAVTIEKRELNRTLRKRAAEIPVGSHMIRQVNVSFPYDHPLATYGLNTFLDTADHCMRTVAASIGASVIHHEWVLLPVEGFDGQLARVGIKGFDLGARVKVAPGAQLQPETIPTYFDLQKTLKTASEAFYFEYGVHIHDIQAPSQYMALQHSDMSLIDITLVDIEPRVINYA
jgi:hypothetical protein